MNCKIITQADLADTSKPTDGWQIIEGHGEHPHITDDWEGVLVIDNDAIEAIVNAGVPEHGLLVDADHLSHEMDKTTQALAWVRELAAIESETEAGTYDLAAYEELTEEGRPLIEGKVYKMHSTEYQSGEGSMEELAPDRLRPLILTGLAYTNRPRNKGQRAITNRAEGATQPQNTETKTMELTPEDVVALCEKFDLNPDESTVEELLNSVDELFNTAAEAEEKAADDIIENSDPDGELSDEEKEAVKEKLVENRDKGKKLLATMMNRIHGTSPAKTSKPLPLGTSRPRTVLNRASAPEKSSKETRILNRAREMQAQGYANRDWNACWNAANKEIQN